MKLGNIISALFAGALFIAGCTEENPISVSELSTKLTPSVVGLAVDGAENATISVDAKEAWTASSDSTWVHFTPASGSAGKSSVTVSVDENEGRERTATIIFKSTSGKSILTVIQAGVPHGLTEDDPLTCKEAQDLCKEIGEGNTTSQWYYVKGIVTQVVEEFGLQYGNGTFWIGDEADDEKVFEVYRALYIGNKKYDNTNLQNVHRGDIVMVYSPLTNYKGTAETVQNQGYLISIEEGETASISLESDAMEVEGSATQAKFNVKGNNLIENIKVSTDATWIKSYTQELDPAGGEVVVTFDANEASESRTAEFIISSEEVEGEPLKFTLTQGKHLDKGTVDAPYTVAEVIDALKAGPVTGNVYVKGIISNIVEKASAQYGNATFWISDDGVFNDNLDKDFEAYRVKWLGGTLEAPTDGADIKTNIMVGDEVVLYGAVTAFTKNDATTYETSSGKAKLYSLNWAQSEEDGVGNIDYPFNIAGAKKFIDDTQAALAAAKANGGSLDLPDVAVKGKVNELVSGGYGAQYGNGTFWISDDGTAKDFEVYRALYLENKKFEEGMTNVAVGDEVIVKGQLTKYNTTYETSQNNAYLYSLNGVTTVSSGPSFAIDGDFADWEAVETTFTGINDRIVEWKAASDANNVYFYYKMTAAKIKTDGSSKFYVGFNLDNDAATGSQGEHGAAGNNGGLEALAYFYPWNAEANAVKAAGVDDSSWVQNPVGTETGAKVTVGGKIEEGFAYLEVSIPRSAIGSPASGAEITVKTAVQYYPTTAEIIALQ